VTDCPASTSPYYTTQTLTITLYPTQASSGPFTYPVYTPGSNYTFTTASAAATTAPAGSTNIPTGAAAGRITVNELVVVAGAGVFGIMAFL